MAFTQFAAAEAGDHTALVRMLKATADEQYQLGNISREGQKRLHRGASRVATLMIEDARGARGRIADQLHRHGSHDLSPHCTTLHGRPAELAFDASAGWSIRYAD